MSVTKFCFYTKDEEKIELETPDGVKSLKMAFKRKLPQYRLFHIYCTCDALCFCDNGYIVETENSDYITPLLRINDEGEEEEIMIYPNLGVGLYNLE